MTSRPPMKASMLLATLRLSERPGRHSIELHYLWDVSGRYGPETVKQKVWSEAENGEQDRGEVSDATLTLH